LRRRVTRGARPWQVRGPPSLLRLWRGGALGLQARPQGYFSRARRADKWLRRAKSGQKRTTATGSFSLVSYRPLAKNPKQRFVPGRVYYAPRCEEGIGTGRGRRNFDSAGRYDDWRPVARWRRGPTTRLRTSAAAAKPKRHEVRGCLSQRGGEGERDTLCTRGDVTGRAARARGERRRQRPCL